jgi:hypothetical protein
MQRDLVHAAEGLLGGFAGTLLMNEAMKLAPRLPESLRPPSPTRHPGEYIVSRIERAFGRTLPERVHRTLVERSAWPYGLVGPTAFAVAVPRLVRLRTPTHAVVAGAALGLGVWAVGYLGWLPAAGLIAPIQRQRPTRVLSGVLSHAAYGIAAMMPVYLIERALRRRGGWRNRFR